jgi:hypothetical protein
MHLRYSLSARERHAADAAPAKSNQGSELRSSLRDTACMHQYPLRDDYSVDRDLAKWIFRIHVNKQFVVKRRYRIFDEMEVYIYTEK